MPKLANLLLLSIALTLVGFFGACSQTPKDPALEKAGNPQVSSIPWNRPQSWESGGGLGGFGDPRNR